MAVWCEGRHGRPGQRCICVAVLEVGLRVQSRHRGDAPQVGVVCWLGELRVAILGARVVRYQVKVLSRGCGNGEGLLEESICLVSISLRLVFLTIFIAASTRFWSPPGSTAPSPESSSSLSLHLSVGEKAPRHAAGAPGLPVRPSPHASLPLIPYKHRAGPDFASFFF